MGLKMKDVTFTYPTRDTPTIYNINIECSRISRVGVIGANGAGKSTAIKILIGELKTTQGEVSKHPGLRLAYIAQHAFFHLEKHLNKTPTQYIMWRFAGNEVKWKNKPVESSMWVKREILIKMGAIKLVQRQDEKEAMAAGLSSKNLTTKDIEKHFADF